MKQRENRPFRFSICVWLATVILVPVVSMLFKHFIGWYDPKVMPEPWDPDLQILPLFYLISFVFSFLLLGVFYLAARLAARSAMPVSLAKALLSVFAFGLIWLAFYLIDAEFEVWVYLLIFRCYYSIAILSIWVFPLRNKRGAADIAATA